MSNHKTLLGHNHKNSNFPNNKLCSPIRVLQGCNEYNQYDAVDPFHYESNVLKTDVAKSLPLFAFVARCFLGLTNQTVLYIVFRSDV